MSTSSTSSDADQLSIFWSNTEMSPSRVGQLIHAKNDETAGASPYGEWAQNEIDLLAGYIGPGDFVIDVGASIGLYSLSFARTVGETGRVWAFEPDPVNGLLLRLNVTNAGLDDVVVPFDIAVSERVQICRIRTVPLARQDRSGIGAAGEYPRMAAGLDQLDPATPPALVRIAIEDGELAALRGMRELLERHRPVVGIEADDDRTSGDIARFMGELGFDVYDAVTDASGLDTFSERRRDVWKSSGRSARLLCLSPDHHRKPDGLTMRRSAGAARGTATFAPARRETQATILDEFRYLPSASTTYEVGWNAWKGLRGDIRSFVAGCLKTGIARLDPVHYREVVENGLDYLAADSVQSESAALRNLMLSALKALESAAARAREAPAQAESPDAEHTRHAAHDQELTQARADLARLREDGRVRIGELEGRAASLDAELATARTELAALAAEKQAADDRHRRGAAELDLIRNALRELAGRLAVSEQSAAELESRAGEMDADLAAMRAAHDEVSAGKSSAEAANADLERRVAAQSQEIQRLRALA